MLFNILRCVMLLQIVDHFSTVQSLQQHVKLSDSYLPVAMQVIAHLTDQMAYEVKDEPAKPTPRPATTTPRPSTTRPGAWTTRPSNPWTTQRPYVTWPSYGYWNNNGYWNKNGYWNNNGWRMKYGLMLRSDSSTQNHRPGLYAPAAPPPPGERTNKDKPILLPPNHQHLPYKVIRPSEMRTEETLLHPEFDQIDPLVDPKPSQEHLLPPHFEMNSKLRKAEADTDDTFLIDDELISDSDMQLLTPDLKEMLKQAYSYDDDSLMEDLRKGDDKMVNPKGKVTTSNLRLTLLYDLLSRDAKKQRLNDFSGFTNSVLQDMSETSNAGARSQLRFALSRMVDRRDCTHDYANNRAREMIAELAKDESTLSNEIRYLQPLVYRV